MSNNHFLPAHKCIYCNSAEVTLTDEHIIPYSLNGIHVLPKSSCLKCADITKKLEQHVARNMYGIFRTRLNFQTRRKKDRPKSFKFEIHDEHNNIKNIDLPISQHPNFYLSIDAPEPGILVDLPPSGLNPELTLNIKYTNPHLQEFIDKHQPQGFSIKQSFQWGYLFRTIAKIAHAYAYAETGGIGYTHLLPDIILGKSDHISHYVGGLGNEFDENASGSELALSLVDKPSGFYLVANIQLLGHGFIPPYIAVVGKIDDLDLFMTHMIKIKNSNEAAEHGACAIDIER